jgi:RNA polymerase sigma-70 factor (ECF subfamily)
VNERRRRRELSDDAADHALGDDMDEQVAALREAMKELPDKERLALHAFYLQELDADRAGEVVGLSRSGLYYVLSRARRRLARVLRKQEATP